jgi:probable rRNA maturation factor
MTGTVETIVQIKSPDWQTALPNAEALCQKAAAAVWKAAHSSDKNFEATVVLSDDAFVQYLNRDYRHQDKPTNVLSFPTSEKERSIIEDVPSLGDIVIAFETTNDEAQGTPATSLGDHLSHLVVHGCLHVLGHNHEENAAAIEMESLETKILASLGIDDPYA